MNKKYLSALALTVILAGAGTTLHANAQTTPPNQEAPKLEMNKNGGMRGLGMRPAAFGTVTAVNGNTISISGQNFKDQTTQTLTIDATNAKITKNKIAGTIGSILVGDKIMVVGTLNGTTIIATQINDGIMMGGKRMMEQGTENKNGLNMQNIPTGNGQPIVGGTVSAITGTTITLTNTSGATYTVDASNAKITKQGTQNATITNVTANDTVIVQGTVNGQNVTAVSILDNGPLPTTQLGQTANTQPQQRPGFFGMVGGFFKHMFGF